MTRSLGPRRLLREEEGRAKLATKSRSMWWRRGSREVVASLAADEALVLISEGVSAGFRNCVMDMGWELDENQCVESVPERVLLEWAD